MRFSYICRRFFYPSVALWLPVVCASAAMAADWQNPADPLDVRGDGVVAAADVIEIVNELNGPVFSDPVTGALPIPPSPPNPPPFLDVSGDDFVSLLDMMTVRDAINGITTSVGPSGDLVRVRLETSNEVGDPISRIGLGSTFFLNVFVEDIHDEPSGVGAAFLDVRFDPALVSPGGVVTPGEFFSLRAPDTSTPGLLDEGGGLRSTQQLGAGEFLLFSVPFLADAPGVVTFLPEPATLTPMHDVLLSGLTEPVPTDRIVYVGASITVVPEPSGTVLLSLAVLVLLSYQRRQRQA